MTTVHPRRALAEAEAAAWLELHADWCRGLPAEVRDTRVIGELFHPLIGDGWTTQSWHQAPRPESRRFRSVGTREHFGHAFRVERMIEAPAVRRAAVRDCSTSGPLPTTSGRLPMPAAGEPLPLRGRALRAVAQQGTEQLRPVTVVMGDRVPAAMRYDRHADADSRHQGVTQAFADLSGHADTRWQEQMAAAELLAWLQAEHGLTALESEALQRRAAGVAQPTRSDRYALERAQRRAVEVLLAGVQEARTRREPDLGPLPAVGADFGCSPARALALQEELGWTRLARRSSYQEYQQWRRSRAHA